MGGNYNGFSPLLAFFALVFLGCGMVIWTATVPAAELTRAHTVLLGLGDMMVKGAVGAILGYSTGRWHQQRGNSNGRE